MEGTAEDRGVAVHGFTAMFKEQQGSQGLEPTVLELRSHRVTGLNEAWVLDVLSQKEFNERQCDR